MTASQGRITARAVGILAALGTASVAELAQATGIPQTEIEAARDHYSGKRNAGAGSVGAHPAPAESDQPDGLSSSSIVVERGERASANR